MRARRVISVFFPALVRSQICAPLLEVPHTRVLCRSPGEVSSRSRASRRLLQSDKESRPVTVMSTGVSSNWGFERPCALVGPVALAAHDPGGCLSIVLYPVESLKLGDRACEPTDGDRLMSIAEHTGNGVASSGASPGLLSSLAASRNAAPDLSASSSDGIACRARWRLRGPRLLRWQAERPSGPSRCRYCTGRSW